VRAQIHSGAFDPKCYQPKIGVEIDTIMGSKNGQHLGQGLINIGPSVEDPDGPGRLLMYGLSGTLNDGSGALLNMGAIFNPKNLRVTKQPNFKILNPIPGHFRSSEYIDLLTEGDGYSAHDFPRIYWQSDSGTYDSINYTLLKPGTLAFPTLNGWMPPYHGHLTSDTVEDIVFLFNPITPDGLNASDSEFACLYRGGAPLFTQPGDTLFTSEKVLVDTEFIGRLSFAGNFRGVGRTDLVTSDNKGNLFLYRADPPFDLAKFAKSLRDDTLFAYWMAPWTFPSTFNATWSGTTAKVFDPTKQDDLLLWLDSAQLSTEHGRQIRIVHGGPSFGSERIRMEELPVIHEPGYFDGGSFRGGGWGHSIGNMKDCGDLTGTGDHVLAVPGNFGEDQTFFTFYVLGSSFDEKVDMFFFEPVGGVTNIDTATLDADRLQDVVISMPTFPILYDGSVDNRYRGTVLFVHGSTKIPVKNQSVSDSKSLGLFTTVSTDGRWLDVQLPNEEVGECSLLLRDILGRTICAVDKQFGSPARMPLPPHTKGIYLLEVRSNEKVYKLKVLL